MKLFTTGQIAEIDRYTIENEPIADIDLMERAAGQVTRWLADHFPPERKMVFFAGPGNNGGDALAIARQMADRLYSCEVILPDFERDMSPSALVNLSRLNDQAIADISRISNLQEFPLLSPSDVIVDGLFGSGLTRPLSGFAASLVNQINQTGNKVIAIDIPSGLMGEDNGIINYESVVRADITLTFQFPKIAFLFSENDKYVGSWEVLPIGLHPEGINKIESPFSLIDNELAVSILPQRHRFSHKGDFGHALLISGSYGKMGAAVLASKACLHSGAGLLTAHVPKSGCEIMQTAVPEAMVSVDQNDQYNSGIPDLNVFSAIGTGPGLGNTNYTRQMIEKLLSGCRLPLVLDADALNIISEDRRLLLKIAPGSILTPHPGEFRRLAGDSSDSFDRLKKQIALSQSLGVIIVLKGAFTSVSLPDGHVFFNSTGNPGMATAGSGDVLTGIILGLLSQKIEPWKAAVLGVYLHGLAGDLAARDNSGHFIIAGDIINYLGKAFLRINP